MARLRIWGFRGTREADLRLDGNAVLVGPNGCGKSTVIDALSLVLGRTKMVRQLTEHDFTGSDPKAETRIRVVATLGGFSSDDPDDHDGWFRMGRGVPKWLAQDGAEHPSAGHDRRLVVNVGFSARFDRDELEVDTVRYFHDDDDAMDPFDEDGGLTSVSFRLLNELGYFVLPARRSWDAVASFNSELFRRTVSNAAGIPADEVLEQRDRLRDPTKKIEESVKLVELVAGINSQLARLVLDAPRFHLRVTAGDSEAVLQALLPHYKTSVGPLLPAARHGSGLVSLQSLLLLLAVGRARKANGLPFVLALEEPELHLASGLHGRLVSEAVALADQVVCTTHSPDVAHVFSATATFVVKNRAGELVSRPFLGAPLKTTASNNERKLYLQNRNRVVEALMCPFVLVPEGRFDAEWLARLAALADPHMKSAPPFATVFGIVPTENAAVEFTVSRLKPLRDGIVALVDGDSAGDDYVKKLVALSTPPETIVQWRSGWAIEDVVRWILGADKLMVERLQLALPGFSFETLDKLTELLLQKNDPKKGICGLKEDVIAHEAIVSELGTSEACVARLVVVCEALVSVATGAVVTSMVKQPASTASTTVFRFEP